jgi:hypothetical protein
MLMSIRPVCVCAAAGAAHTASANTTAENLIGLGLLTGTTFRLLREPIEDVYKLREAFGPFRFAFRDAIRHALLDVETEDGKADAVEGGFRRGELLEDLDAQPRFLHHSTDAADLPLDSVQTGDDSLLLRLVQH